MTRINDSNSSKGFPATAESKELQDLIQVTGEEMEQIPQEPPSSLETRKPAASRTGEPQVTGRRAAVKVGGMAQQYALNSLLPTMKADAKAAGKLAVGKDDGPPPAANATQKAADQVYDKIKSKLPKLGKITSGNYPQLSKEEEMAADFSAGIGKYKEYVDYAKNALDKIKNMPNGPAKEKLKQLLADRFGQLSSFLDGLAGKLGKIKKYADMFKDAIAITDSVRDFAKDFRNMDMTNIDSVKKMLDSLGKANDRVQNVASGIAETLLSKGTKVGATAGLVTAYVGVMLTVGIEGGRALAEAKKQYYDKLQQRLDIAANEGFDPRQNIKLPDEPPPLQTYAQLRESELNLERQWIRRTVEKEFSEPRQQVKNEFDAAHTKAHDEFTNKEFPKMYLEKRQQILAQLRAEKNHLLSAGHETLGGPRGRFDTVYRLQEMIDELERPASELTPEHLQHEIQNLQKGSADSAQIRDMLTKTYSRELNKYYEQKGVGEGALEKRYENAGVSEKVIDRMYEEKIREAGLE